MQKKKFFPFPDYLQILSDRSMDNRYLIAIFIHFIKYNCNIKTIKEKTINYKDSSGNQKNKKVSIRFLPFHCTKPIIMR